MKRFIFHPAWLVLLAFGCNPESTRTRTFTGERACVRGDGAVTIARRGADTQPTTSSVYAPALVGRDADIQLIEDVPLDRPLKIIKRVTVGGRCMAPARTLIEIHAHAGKRTVVRDRAEGSDPGLVCYE